MLENSLSEKVKRTFTSSTVGSNTTAHLSFEILLTWCPWSEVQMHWSLNRWLLERGLLLTYSDLLLCHLESLKAHLLPNDFL